MGKPAVNIVPTLRSIIKIPISKAMEKIDVPQVPQVHTIDLLTA
jgi:hypothetical protein